MSQFELLAALLGVVSVYLSARQNVWSWPIGIANVAMYVFVFHEAKLYADMGLQVVYIVLSLYGWYHWLYGAEHRRELPVSRLSARTGVVLVALGVACAAMLGGTLSRRTDASLPFLDSVTTVTSLIAQWMMTRKLLESWIVWIAVDVVYVGMFIFLKPLYPTAAQYAVFLALAALGFVQWRRSLDPVR